MHILPGVLILLFLWRWQNAAFLCLEDLLTIRYNNVQITVSDNIVLEIFSSSHIASTLHNVFVQTSALRH